MRLNRLVFAVVSGLFLLALLVAVMSGPVPHAAQAYEDLSWATTATPVAKDDTPQEVVLHPPWQWVGWVASNEAEGSQHFGDSAIYSGYYNNVAYYGLIRFSLDDIVGAPVYSATLSLTGLDGDRLEDDGTWTVELLEAEPGDIPRDTDSFYEIHRCDVSPDISFTLDQSQLGPGEVNELVFSDEQLGVLEDRANLSGQITFRISGPRQGKNALFAWDSGYGLKSQGARPELATWVGSSSETPPDDATFIKQSVSELMEAGQTYDVSITMKNEGSNTWIPEGRFSYRLSSLASGGNTVWGGDAAKLPGEVAPGQVADILFTVKAPDEPGEYDFQWQMVHDSVPGRRFGDLTEKVSIQVTESKPTPTPMPTATPEPTITPISVPFPDPTMTPTPVATPAQEWDVIPSDWTGRIVFKSDRDGGQEGYYIMDADGSNVEQLTGDYYYEAAALRDTISPDNEYRLMVASRQPDHPYGWYDKMTSINLYRMSDGHQRYLVGDELNPDFDPAYCTADPRYFAWTSMQGGLADIYVADLLDDDTSGQLRTTRMTQNTNDWEWDKHPSWSADCDLIVFHSNRTGKDQIWMMEFWSMDYDGQVQYQISNDLYNDWDPIWIK